MFSHGVQRCDYISLKFQYTQSSEIWKNEKHSIMKLPVGGIKWREKLDGWCRSNKDPSISPHLFKLIIHSLVLGYQVSLLLFILVLPVPFAVYIIVTVCQQWQKFKYWIKRIGDHRARSTKKKGYTLRLSSITVNPWSS